jgi:hypothetical protein
MQKERVDPYLYWHSNKEGKNSKGGWEWFRSSSVLVYQLMKKLSRNEKNVVS